MDMCTESPKPQIGAAPVDAGFELPEITRGFFWSVVAVSLVIAAFKRLAVISPPGFPIGEGGLFLLFSETILNNDFAMPTHVVFGGVTLPFAYSPASFYLAAAIAKASGADLLTVYYYLPIALNILAVPAFCFLAAQVTKDRAIFICAAIIYVQLPDSFIWQITAAGATRSLAALFSLLAVGLALRVSTTQSKRLLLLCGLCVGLSILSHMEWGLFAASGVTLAFLSKAGHWKAGILFTGGAGMTAALVISPWVAAVLARHGLDPFLSSSSASQWNAGGFLVRAITGQAFGLLAWPAILGAFVTMSRGSWFLISWTLLTLLLTPRMGASSGLAIPASLLAAFGFKTLADYVRRAILSMKSFSATAADALARPSLFGISLPVLYLLLAFSVAFASPLRRYSHPELIVAQLDRPTRDAMRWIAERTEPGSSFVVVSQAEAWWADRAAEWFPFLARRGSLTTAQGLEWAGPGVFLAKLDQIADLKSVQAGAPTLIPELVRERYCYADYVAMFAPRAAPERRAFEGSEDFQPVFENDGAAILAMPPGETACARSEPASRSDHLRRLITGTACCGP